jgi:hypothetical protein
MSGMVFMSRGMFIIWIQLLYLRFKNSVRVRGIGEIAVKQLLLPLRVNCRVCE